MNLTITLLNNFKQSGYRVQPKISFKARIFQTLLNRITHLYLILLDLETDSKI
jgi:hypothetical protein